MRNLQNEIRLEEERAVAAKVEEARRREERTAKAAELKRKKEEEAAIRLKQEEEEVSYSYRNSLIRVSCPSFTFTTHLIDTYIHSFV